MNEIVQPSSDKRPAQMQVVRQEVQFSGPLPPPEILEKYDRVLPGAAERIFVMAEQQAQHRRQLEAVVIRSDTINAKLGLWLGFLIGLAGIGSGVLIAVYSSIPAGSLLSFTALAMLAGTFVYGSRLRSKERQDRRERQRE